MTVTDVTPRAAAVVWASSTPVLAATVRVFADVAGTAELTASLDVTLASAAFPPALARGIVKVDVDGLAPDTSVFVQTLTVNGDGLVALPAVPPFIEVHTAARASRAQASALPIASEVLRHELREPDGSTPAAGALLLVDVPGLSAYPLSAFAGQGAALPTALVDLGNLYSAGTRTSVELAAGTVIRLTELRGATCTGLVDHRQLRFRRSPTHATAPGTGSPITAIAAPVSCFFADTVCDGAVNVLDVQRVLNAFNRRTGQCAYNPDLDLVSDGTVNVLDVQSVLNRFGQNSPFPP